MQKKILIIDDEAFVTDLFKEFFSGEGYQATIANTNDEALEKIEKGSFDLIVLDANMPCFEKENIYFKIIRMENAGKTPIVLTSAGGVDLELVEGIKKRTADTFFAKPTEIDVIREKIKECFLKAG